MRVSKDGTAYWLLGSIVEVGVRGVKHDPNTYRARCLTAGTFPTIQVLHERYPEPIEGRAVDPPYVIWREIAASEEDEQQAIAEQARRIDEVRTVCGAYVIVGQRKGAVHVVRQDDDEDATPVAEAFDSIDAAEEWLRRNVCAECGYLVVDAAGEGCSRRHIGVPRKFSF
jgi:hypothetical protein